MAWIQVVTEKPTGGRGLQRINVETAGANVDVLAGESEAIYTVPLVDFVSSELVLTVFNKTEKKTKYKKYIIVQNDDELEVNSSSIIGGNISFDTEFNIVVDDMSIVITNNNVYTITVSSSHNILAN